MMIDDLPSNAAPLVRPLHSVIDRPCPTAPQRRKVAFVGEEVVLPAAPPALRIVVANRPWAREKRN